MKAAGDDDGPSILWAQRRWRNNTFWCTRSSWSGPHVYSLSLPASLPAKVYGFPERTVAILFGTVFPSAGLAAPWVGASLSQYYSLVARLADCLNPLFSAFERGQPGGSSRILGRAPLANGFVATAAADQLVQIDTKSAEAMHSGPDAYPAPSRASVGLASSALVAIRATWSDNHGRAV
ncbi:hypothetical protein EV714DRAFT_268224 [Schizophyllum commune]